MLKQTLPTLLLALCCVAHAKQPVVNPVDEADWEPEHRWDMCTVLETMGDWVYRDRDNPYIQGLRFNGRLHLQYAQVDGEGVDAANFSEEFDEVRRLRVGTELRFLQFFELKAGADFISDRTPFGEGRHVSYQNFDSLLLTFDAAKAFDIEFFDDVDLSYGRHKIAMGQEAHRSSRTIKTVERSAIANKVYPIRATGLTLHLAKDDWSGTAGVFSTGFSTDVAGWDDGKAYYLTSTYELPNNDDIIIDLLYNDSNGDLDNELTDRHGYHLYEWAASAAYVIKRDRLRIVLNAIYGDNGAQINPEREGEFYGFVVMPSYWIVEDRIEAVIRYSYQASEEDEGIRMNGRYARREHRGRVNDGRGDKHESIYAGLNLHFCEGKSKFMLGIEHESLDTDSGTGEAEVDTLWLAYRMYF